MNNDNLAAYKILPVWTAETLPDGFKQQHNTKPGTWAKLQIFKGRLNFAMLDAAGNITEEYQFSTDRQPPLIEPQQWHKIIAVSDDISCQLTFYCQKEDYCSKKYDLTATHADVIIAAQRVKTGTVLDLGCGAGRNALYLNMLGFDVTAVDKNEANIDQINQIIKNIQSSTRSGGYNVIVCAMSTSDYPCPMPFSFTFQENELRDYYQNWNIIEYNENIGALHKTDINGNRIQLRFATLHAIKP